MKRPQRCIKDVVENKSFCNDTASRDDDYFHYQRPEKVNHIREAAERLWTEPNHQTPLSGFKNSERP